MLADLLLKIKKQIQKSRERRDSKYIYQNELDKACVQHDMAYGDFKDLPGKTAVDKVLRDKAFNIAKNPKYDGYQHRLALMVYNFFDKITFNTNKETGSYSDVVSENKELAEELHKPIIRKNEKRKIHSNLISRQYLGC